MKMRFFVVSAALLLCATLALGQQATGKWTSAFESQVGEQKYVFEFKAEGEKLTGKITGETKGEKRPPVDVTDGKIKGDEISFVEVLKLKDMELRVEYSGKIKGDEMKLKRKVGDIAEYDITLKKSNLGTSKTEDKK
jgi:hypothetical protein